MKFIQTFEHYTGGTIAAKNQHLNPDDINNETLKYYYDSIKILCPEIFRKLEIISNEYYESSIIIGFENSKPVPADLETEHTGEHWGFGINLINNEFEIVCENTGDSEPIDSLHDILIYCLGIEDELLKAWKILTTTDSRYKIECPNDILKQVQTDAFSKIITDIGVFEK